MKFAWRKDLIDISWWNNKQVEDINLEFGEFLYQDKEGQKWNEEDIGNLLDVIFS